MMNNLLGSNPIRAQFEDEAEELRACLLEWLAERNVPSMIYYPVPLHLQDAYKDLGYKEGDLPVSEELSHKVLSLPIHTEMDETQLAYITSQVQSFFKS